MLTLLTSIYGILTPSLWEDGGGCHRYYDALAAHHAYVLPQGDVLPVGRHGLPVVAVDGHSAVAATLYGLAHAAYAPHQGVGVAQTLAPLAVNRLGKARPYKEERQQRGQHEHYELAVKAYAEGREYGRDECAYGETQDEEVARRELKYQADDDHQRPELPQVGCKIIYHTMWFYGYYGYVIVKVCALAVVSAKINKIIGPGKK